MRAVPSIEGAGAGVGAEDRWLHTSAHAASAFTHAGPSCAKAPPAVEAPILHKPAQTGPAGDAITTMVLTMSAPAAQRTALLWTALFL